MLHLLSGDFPRLWHDVAYALIVGLSVLLNRAHPRAGVLLFYAALAPFALWIDRQGHAAGDEWLRVFADALRTRLGPGETAFRLGGDEYVVLCEVDDLEAVLTVVRAAVLEVQRRDFPEIGASVGSAAATEVRSLGALVRLADERMYLEKRGKPQRRTQVPV